MSRLVIDSDNYAAAGIETMFFPGGEPHAKLPQFTGDVLLYLKLRTWADVGRALVVSDAISRQVSVKHIRAFIPYFPGARQDRTDGTSPLTYSLMADLLPYAYVFDVHNDNFNLHISNFMPSDLKLPQRPDVDFVIAPDKGAVSRANSFRSAYCPNAELICATKSRDPATGKLSNYELPELPRAGKYLVVDDICDGGGTFVLLAKAFEKKIYSAASRLELFVSHGIFSKGFDALNVYYDQIYTTDSFFKPATNALSYVNCHSLDPIVKELAND